MYADIAPSASNSAERYQQAAAARAEGTRRSCAVSFYVLVTGTAALMGRYFAARRCEPTADGCLFGCIWTGVASRARTMKRSGAGPMYENG